MSTSTDLEMVRAGRPPTPGTMMVSDSTRLRREAVPYFSLMLSA